MSCVIESLIIRICQANLDNVIVLTKSQSYYILDYRSVFDCIQTSGFKLKPANCLMFAKKPPYLGHLISAASVSFNPAKLRVFEDKPNVLTICKMQLFFIFVNMYGDNITNFTDFIAPLYDLTKNR